MPVIAALVAAMRPPARAGLLVQAIAGGVSFRHAPFGFFNAELVRKDYGRKPKPSIH